MKDSNQVMIGNIVSVVCIVAVAIISILRIGSVAALVTKD